MTAFCVPAETPEYFTLSLRSACLLADEGLAPLSHNKRPALPSGFVQSCCFFSPNHTATTANWNAKFKKKKKRQERSRTEPFSIMPRSIWKDPSQMSHPVKVKAFSERATQIITMRLRAVDDGSICRVLAWAFMSSAKMLHLLHRCVLKDNSAPSFCNLYWKPYYS